jgi:hypothetical protein
MSIERSKLSAVLPGMERFVLRCEDVEDAANIGHHNNGAATSDATVVIHCRYSSMNTDDSSGGFFFSRKNFCKISYMDLTIHLTDRSLVTWYSSLGPFLASRKSTFFL